MSIVPVTDTTVIVRVDQVFQVPTLLGDYTDKEITLLVQDAGGLKRGEQAIFFTQGWLVGASVAVQEVGRVKKDTLMNPDKQIDDARRHIADQNLRARLASANLVIAGQVERVRMASEPTPPSEHAPQWMESILAVEAVLKGNIAEHVVVFFPASRDIAWFRAPKFQTGQEGIWILQRDRERDVYTALDPLDFQPKDQLERIKVLLK